MTSNHGADTSKIMDQLRRDAKSRQARGAGSRRPQEQKIDIKEAAQFVPRHHSAELSPDTRQALNDWQALQARSAPIGAKSLYEFISKGGIVVGSGDKAITHPIKVVLTGRDAQCVGLDGTEVIVTSAGITGVDNQPLRLAVWSVTILLNSGSSPLFGLRVEYNKGAVSVF